MDLRTAIFCGLQIACLATVALACPLDYEARIAKCFLDVGIDLGDPLVNSTRAKQACMSDHHGSALQCIDQNVVSKCTSTPEQEEVFKKYVDIDLMREGVELWCDNIDKIIAHELCLNEAHFHPARTACATESHGDFQAEFTRMVVTGSFNRTRYMDLYCTYTNEVLTCGKESNDKFCGLEMAELIDDYTRKMSPPICGSSSLSFAFILLLISLLGSMLF